jgi:hypothetical protein
MLIRSCLPVKLNCGADRMREAHSGPTWYLRWRGLAQEIAFNHGRPRWDWSFSQAVRSFAPLNLHGWWVRASLREVAPMWEAGRCATYFTRPSSWRFLLARWITVGSSTVLLRTRPTRQEHCGNNRSRTARHCDELLRDWCHLSRGAINPKWAAQFCRFQHEGGEP